MCCLGDSSGDGVARRSVNRGDLRFSVSQVPGGTSYDPFMKTTNLSFKKSVTRSPVPRGFLLIAVLLTCFALSATAEPCDRDGCDANGATFQGELALSNNASGLGNTAMGDHALYGNTTGNDNTAIGSGVPRFQHHGELQHVHR